MARRWFEYRGPRRSHQRLWGWQQPWHEDPFGQRRDLSIGKNGTLSEDSQETDNVELERVQADIVGIVLFTDPLHFGGSLSS